MFGPTGFQCLVLCLYALDVEAHSLKIPENPCPDVFRYRKKSGSGEIYGEAVVPYDGGKSLEFTISASMAGYFENVELQIQLATPLRQFLKEPLIKYHIFFPHPQAIPKVTQITYNGRVYCSGRPIALKSGVTGLCFSRLDQFQRSE